MRTTSAAPWFRSTISWAMRVWARRRSSASNTFACRENKWPPEGAVSSVPRLWSSPGRAPPPAIGAVMCSSSVGTSRDPLHGPGQGSSRSAVRRRIPHHPRAYASMVHHCLRGLGGNDGVRVAMGDLPLAVLPTEDGRDAQRGRSDLLGVARPDPVALDLDDVGQVSARTLGDAIESEELAVMQDRGRMFEGLLDLTPPARGRAERVRERGVVAP